MRDFLRVHPRFSTWHQSARPGSREKDREDVVVSEVDFSYLCMKLSVLPRPSLSHFSLFGSLWQDELIGALPPSISINSHGGRHCKPICQFPPLGKKPHLVLFFNAASVTSHCRRPSFARLSDNEPQEAKTFIETGSFPPVQPLVIMVTTPPLTPPKKEQSPPRIFIWTPACPVETHCDWSGW